VIIIRSSVPKGIANSRGLIIYARVMRTKTKLGALYAGCHFAVGSHKACPKYTIFRLAPHMTTLHSFILPYYAARQPSIAHSRIYQRITSCVKMFGNSASGAMRGNHFQIVCGHEYNGCQTCDMIWHMQAPHVRMEASRGTKIGEAGDNENGSEYKRYKKQQEP
jgi:hypothetical protein